MKQLLLIFLLLLSFQAISQQKAFDTVHHRNFAGIILTEIPFGDYQLYYEHRLAPSHGLKFTFGYKPATDSYTDATYIDMGLEPTEWCYRKAASWISLTAGYRFYYDRKKLFYVSGEISCKKGWSDMIGFSYGTDHGSSTLTNVYQMRKLDANIAGINVLLGKKIRFEVSKAFNLGLDVYFGVSFRYKEVNEEIYGSTTVSRYHDESPDVTVQFYDQAQKLVTTKYFAAPQLGLILCGSW